MATSVAPWVLVRESHYNKLLGGQHNAPVQASPVAKEAEVDESQPSSESAVVPPITPPPQATPRNLTPPREAQAAVPQKKTPQKAKRVKRVQPSNPKSKTKVVKLAKPVFGSDWQLRW